MQQEINTKLDEIRSLFDTTTLTREECATIWRFCLFARLIVSLMPELAFSANRIFMIENSEPEVVEAIQKANIRLKVKEKVKDVIKLSRIFGYATFAIACEHNGEKIPLSQALSAKQVREGNISINVIDPMLTSSTQPELDPTKYGFMELRRVYVGNERLHHSRGVAIQHTMPIYNEYTNSAYTFSGTSIFQSIYSLLIIHQNLCLNIKRMAEIGGSLMVNQPSAAFDEEAGSNFVSGGKAQQQQTLGILSTIKRWGVAIWGRKTEVNYLGMQGTTDVATALEIIEKIISHEIPDTPNILFSDTAFSKGLSEGIQDMKFIQQAINDFREKAEPIYRIVDKYLQAIAWTPEFCESIRRKYYDKYGDMTYAQMKEYWASDFKYDYDETYPLDKKIEEEIKALRVNTYQVARNMGATLETIQANMEEDKLFKTPLELSKEELFETIEAENTRYDDYFKQGGEGYYG